MAFFYRLLDGSKADDKLHEFVLNGGDKKWEGSKAQLDTIHRHMKMFGCDYETAKSFYSESK